MPKVCPEYPSVRRGFQPFVQPMAIHPVGPRYCRPLPQGSRKKEISVGQHELLHQIGQS